MRLIVELSDDGEAERVIEALESAGFEEGMFVAHPREGRVLVSIVVAGQKLRVAYEVLRWYVDAPLTKEEAWL